MARLIYISPDVARLIYLAIPKYPCQCALVGTLLFGLGDADITVANIYIYEVVLHSPTSAFVFACETLAMYSGSCESAT